jgi:hypothetical protein
MNDLQLAGRYQCLPIRCSGRLISLQNEHSIITTGSYRINPIANPNQRFSHFVMWQYLSSKYRNKETGYIGCKRIDIIVVGILSNNYSMDQLDLDTVTIEDEGRN